MIPVKLCGLTSVEDALLAWELGAAALGFVFHPPSPRAVSAWQVAVIRRELPAGAFLVGVFVDTPADAINRVADEARLDAVQLHGRESPETCTRVERPVIKRIHDEQSADSYEAATWLVDAPSRQGAEGGTGMTADWPMASRLARRHRTILAGGLTPSNALDAVAHVEPAALDVCSGVERAPGVKDPVLLKAFLSLFVSKDRPCFLR